MQIDSSEFLHGRNDGDNAHEPEHVYPWMLNAHTRIHLLLLANSPFAIEKYA